MWQTSSPVAKRGEISNTIVVLAVVAVAVAVVTGLARAAPRAVAASSVSSLDDSRLTLEAHGKSIELRLGDLKRKLTPTEVTLLDPVYKTTRTYVGFPLQAVFEVSGLAQVASADEVILKCADGYAPTTTLNAVRELKPFLAFKLKDHSDAQPWDVVHDNGRDFTFEPFYLVWTQGPAVATPEGGYPWPYQLVGVEWVKFSEKFSRVYPDDLRPRSAAHRGFIVYKNHCMKCHSINGQGGEMGPEFNVPKNILEYWRERDLIAFAQNPASYRERVKMPAVQGVSAAEYRDLATYLRWIGNRKRPSKK